MKYIYNKLAFSIFIGMLILTIGCKKDYTNPNAALATDVFQNNRAVLASAVGIHRTYSLTVLPQMISSNALTTNEAIVVNAGNVSEALLASGGNLVDGNNGLLGSIWINNCKIIFDGDNVINAANKFTDLGYRSGVIGYATIIRSMSYANLCQNWEQVPDSIGNNIANPTKFITRTQGFAKVLTSIDRALALTAANAPSAQFISDAPAGIGTNLVHILNALKARYSLYTGNFAAASAAASLVSTTVAPVFNFEALNPNPVFLTVTATNNVYQPIDSTLGLPIGIQPSLVDARVPFYTLLNASAPRYRMRGFYTSTTQAIPIYLVEEMRLIRAECLLRQTSPDAAAAKLLLDQVLQQTAASDLNGVGAGIAAGYTGSVNVPSLLTEVYRNRCIELYMSGLKLEDMRRFARPNAERKRNFYPYPFRERDGNTNTPPDPSF
jgi:starch-binding outer membrane protein, SusD/RagB family